MVREQPGRTAAELAVDGGPFRRPPWEASGPDLEPVVARRWTGPDGRLWRLRGQGPPALRSVVKLLTSHSHEVVHEYAGAWRVLEAELQRHLALRIDRLLRDGQLGPNDAEAYLVLEFRGTDGARLLLVHETC